AAWRPQQPSRSQSRISSHLWPAYPWWVFEKASSRQVRNTRLYGRKLASYPRAAIYFRDGVRRPTTVSAALCRFPITDSHDQEPPVYRHELVRALMLTVPCWKSFQPPAASTRNASNVFLAVIRQRRSGGRTKADVQAPS